MDRQTHKKIKRIMMQKWAAEQEQHMHHIHICNAKIHIWILHVSGSHDPGRSLDLAGYQALNEPQNVGGHRCGGDYPIVSFLSPWFLILYP